jgi:hypothetical protein
VEVFDKVIFACDAETVLKTLVYVSSGCNQWWGRSSARCNQLLHRKLLLFARMMLEHDMSCPK